MPNAQRQVAALRMILDAVVESVSEAGELGAPGGVVYAALMAHGVTLQQYEGIMGALVRAGRLRRSGELYFVVNTKE